MKTANVSVFNTTIWKVKGVNDQMKNIIGFQFIVKKIQGP